ncbi:MAG: zinc metallopeptidase [Caulobacterales bacterium]
MIVFGALAAIALLGLIFGPSMWVRAVMRKHAVERPDFPGNGGELARHLLDKFLLPDVGVEETPAGTDHYDPTARVVRLSPENLTGRSITAVTVAAHEVGHALQHRDGDRFLVARTKWASSIGMLNLVAMGLLVSVPIVAILIKSPAIALLQVVAIAALLASRIVMHVLTLPVEFDASFKRALPALQQGGYLSEADLPAARSVLKAAAMTYVAGALASLLDVARWMR